MKLFTSAMKVEIYILMLIRYTKPHIKKIVPNTLRLCFVALRYHLHSKEDDTNLRRLVKAIKRSDTFLSSRRGKWVANLLQINPFLLIRAPRNNENIGTNEEPHRQKKIRERKEKARGFMLMNEVVAGSERDPDYELIDNIVSLQAKTSTGHTFVLDLLFELEKNNINPAAGCFALLVFFATVRPIAVEKVSYYSRKFLDMIPSEDRFGFIRDQIPQSMVQYLAFGTYNRLSAICGNDSGLEDDPLVLAEVFGKTSIEKKALVITDAPGGWRRVCRDFPDDVETFVYCATELIPAGGREPSGAEYACPLLAEAKMKLNDSLDVSISIESRRLATELVHSFFTACSVTLSDRGKRLIWHSYGLALSDQIYSLCRMAVNLEMLLKDHQFNEVFVVMEGLESRIYTSAVLRRLTTLGFDPVVFIGNDLPRISKDIYETVRKEDFFNSLKPKSGTVWSPVVSDLLCSVNATPLVKHRASTEKKIPVEMEKVNFLSVFNLNDKNYFLNGMAIIKGLLKHGDVSVLTARVQRDVLDQIQKTFKSELEDGRVKLISTTPANVLGREYSTLTQEFTNAAQSFLLSHSREQCSHVCGVDVIDFILPSVLINLSIQLPTAVHFARQLRNDFANGGYSGVITSPGRLSTARLITVLAREQGVPVLDVQAVFSSTHPRYLRSLANAYLTINNEQNDMYVRMFGLQDQTVQRVGSLMVHQGMQRFDEYDREQIRRELKISEETKLIVFASQNGIQRTNSASIQALLEALKPFTKYKLLIKCHPKENAAIVARYVAIIKEHSAGDMAKVIVNHDIYAILSAADLVVTQFSNVGLEAAAVGKPVLAMNILDEVYTVDLAQMGVCKEITGQEELNDTLKKFLADPQFGERLLTFQNAYFKKNPEIRDGDPLERIVDCAIEMIEKDWPGAFPRLGGFDFTCDNVFLTRYSKSQ